MDSENVRLALAEERLKVYETNQKEIKSDIKTIMHWLAFESLAFFGLIVTLILKMY